MSETGQARIRAGVVAIAPVLLLIGFLIPYIGDITDNVEIATEIGGDTGRASWGFLIAAGSIALTILATFSLRYYLRAAGEDGWSFLMVPLVVVGAVTIAVAVTAQFFAVALISEAGGDAVAYLDAADDWFVPLFIAGGVIFGLGWLALAMSIYRSAVLSRELTTVVMIALIVVVAANFIPTGWGGYVLAIAAIVASWPLAYTMWPTAVGAPSVGGPPA